MNPRVQRTTPSPFGAVRLPIPPAPPGTFRVFLKAANRAPPPPPEAHGKRPSPRFPEPPHRERPKTNDAPEREDPPPSPLPEPLDRVLWSLRPPAPPEPPLPSPTPTLPPVDQLVDRLLRRIALGGSRHRGTAFLEIGAGGLQGATVAIHAEGGRLSIEVDAPDNESSRRWRSALEERLRERGLEAEILLR